MGKALVPVVLAPLLLGGATLLMARTRLLRRWLGVADNAVHRAQRLGRTIVGHDKHAVAAALGPPQATVPASSAFLANTWYYRLDERQRIAMVIAFRNDIACEARVLHSKAGTATRGVAAAVGIGGR
jgi:hypothetical protein